MRLPFVAALLLTITPALAVDAVTYKGTLGKFDIIAELTDPSSATIVGRYSYLSKGGDIPLDVMDSTEGNIALAEEAPCTDQTCVQNDDGVVLDPPMGAVWTLQWSSSDHSLTGQWLAGGKSGKSLPIALKEIGRRVLPDDTEITPYGLYTSDSAVGDASPVASPYYAAKMSVPLAEGAVQTLDGSSYRLVTDPRSKFGFPRVVTLADGASPEVINAALAARHNTVSSYGFDCLSQIYAGFGANQYSAGMGPGTLGDYDGELIEVHYLSPTLMDWTESGSTFCGGAYPDNHSNNFIFDVKTGAPLALASVFKDWVATSNLNDYGAVVDQAAARAAPQDYSWQAGQTLIDYVRASRTTSDAEREAECGIDELIGTNLGVRFESGDQVVFMLEDLPHVIFACSDDLLTVKLADIPQLLAPTARDYFPALTP